MNYQKNIIQIKQKSIKRKNARNISVIDKLRLLIEFHKENGIF